MESIPRSTRKSVPDSIVIKDSKKKDAVVAALVEVDATLAEIAIDEATAVGGDPDLLAAAAHHFAVAEATEGANAAERAIQAY